MTGGKWFCVIVTSLSVLSFIGRLLINQERRIYRKNKTKKGGSNLEKLINWVTEKDVENLKNAAIIRNDSYLNTKTGNLEECQIISQEYHCHESFRKNP